MLPEEDRIKKSENSSDTDTTDGIITVVVERQLVWLEIALKIAAAACAPIVVFWSAVQTLKGAVDAPVLAGQDLLGVLAAAAGLTGVMIVIGKKAWSVTRANRIEIRVGDQTVSVGSKYLTKADQNRLVAAVTMSRRKHL